MARITLGKVREKPGDASTATGSGSGSGSQDALEFINSVTATNSAVVSSGSFASLATAYVAVKVYVSNLRSATACIVGVRTSSDGTNYSATTNAYTRSGFYNTATQAAVNAETSSSTDMVLISAAATLANLATGAGAAMMAEITLFNLNATATLAFPHITIRGTHMGSNEVVAVNAYGRRTEALPQGGIQLVNRGGGNFIDGRMDVFGVKGSA